MFTFLQVFALTDLLQ